MRKFIYSIFMLVFLSVNMGYSFQKIGEDSKTEVYFEGEVTFNHSRLGTTTLISRDVFKNKEYKRILVESDRFPNQELGEVIYDFKNHEMTKVWHIKKRVQYLAGNELREINKPKIEVTTEYKEILGYRCRKYIVNRYLPAFDKHSTTWVWIAEDLKIKSLEAISKLTGYANAMASVYQFTDGLLLRHDIFNDTGEISATIEAIEITQMTINPEEFKIPTAEDGYSISGRM